MSRSREMAVGGGFLVVALVAVDLGAQSSPPDPGAVQDAVWLAIGGPGQVLKLASDDGAALLAFEAPHVRAVAAGTDRVWTAGHSVRVLDFAGTQTLELPFSPDANDPNEHEGSDSCSDERHDHSHPAISLDARDGSAWISAGKSAYHFGSDGTLLLKITLRKRIVGIAFDPSHERVWLGTKKSLAGFDASGQQLVELAFPSGELRSLSSDPRTGDLWAIAGDDVLRYAGDSLARSEKRVKHVRLVGATTDGRAWVAAKERLILFDGSLTQLGTASLDRKVIALATLADGGDGGAWAATRDSLSRVSAVGSVLYSVNLDEQGTARGLSLSAATDWIAPNLAVESPTDGAFVADQTPTLIVRFSDVGTGVAPETLRFEVGGQPLSMACTSVPGGAACVLASLPEGLVDLSGTVEDVAHNVSSPARVTFTVDVTPPSLIVDSPPSSPDTLTSASTFELRGQVSEPVALAVNGAPVPVELDGSFSTIETLQEGPNVFELLATDRAGLVANATRRVVRDTTPPPPADPDHLFVGESGGSFATLTIDPGGAEPGAVIEIRVTRTGELFTTVVGADGSAVLTFAAVPGSEFVVTVVDSAGNRSTSLTLSVPSGPAIPPDPTSLAPPISMAVVTDMFSANSFLFTGPNAIQQGVSAGTIEPHRIAILRGRVLDRAGAGVPGVRVTAVASEGTGFTTTRSGGFYDFAANGGGDVVLSFQRIGFMEVQRRVATSWRGWATVEDVVLTALDPEVTIVDLNGSPTTQIARSSGSLDVDGARRINLVFPPGISGELVFENGTREALPLASVHITEFTVGPQGPDAMPAPLPPSSHYTFAFEMTAEESRDAVRLEFDRPAAAYVENFLGFSSGIIPVGSYDRQRAVWVPEDNGFVVQVLSVDTGIAELSLDDVGTPADELTLAQLGITPEERIALASLYPSGFQSLWRTAVHHFTQPVDMNHPWLKIPDDATAPRQGLPRGFVREPEPCEVQISSSVECENQTLHEEIAVVGAPSLHYQTDRTEGRRTLDIPVSEGFTSMPPSLRGIEVEIQIEGQREIRSLPPAAGQRIAFSWDGKDAYGRRVQGVRPAQVQIRYQYSEGFYGRPVSSNPRSFGSPGATLVGAGLRADAPVEFEQTMTASLGAFDQLGAGFGGFSLSTHHVYSPDENTVMLGNGETRGPDEIGPVVETVAGNGLSPSLSACATPGVCDGGLGTSVRVAPVAIAPAPDGSIYFSELSQGVSGIRRLRPDGFVERWTGDVGPSLTTGCAPGREVVFDTGGTNARDVAFGPAGPDRGLYIGANGRIARLDLESGILCIVAGNGSPYYSGDGGPALSAGMGVRSLAIAPDGSIWFHDVSPFGSRIRRIGPDGYINTIAGGSAFGNGGDGGPAALAQLGVHPILLLGFTPDGSLHFSDIGNPLFPRIRRIDASGRITREAGTGLFGRGVDGSLALSIPIQLAEGTVTPDGSIIFIDGATVARQIRKIGPDGRLSTIAGQAAGLGFTADGTPARRLTFDAAFPLRSVKVGADGMIYFVEAQRIRRLRPSLPSFTGGQTTIASKSGAELYRFNVAGQHLETRDALTGNLRTAFGYDGQGLLTSMTDADGNVLRVERAPGGEPTAVLAPGGQRTTFALDANGRATSVSNPVGETSRFEWEPDGLLRSYTNPRGNKSRYFYTDLGAMSLAEDAAGGSQALARAGERPDYAVSRTTALGRQTSYRVEDLVTKDQRRTVTMPDGTRSTLVRQADEGRTRIRPDGTSVTVQRTPDPRFGLQAPVTSSRRVATPGGRVSLTTSSRAATLSNPSDPGSLQTLSETTSVNGRPYTSVFNRGSLTSTSTTPEGRSSFVTLDEQGRVVRSQSGNLSPSSFSYDANGLLSLVVAGEGAEARRFQFDYDASHRLISVTDPLDLSVVFGRDAAGRVLEQVFPDGGITRATYDENSNVSSLSPPDRPAHHFEYSPVDLETAYEPPAVLDGGTNRTSRDHDLDRAPTVETRADGSTISPSYDSAGRLASLSHASASLTYSYHPATGRLSQVSATGGGTLSFGFDGPLPTTESLAGPVSGSIARTFDDDFRLSSETVNGGNAATFAYDLDGLMVRAGDLTLSRDPENGLLTGSEFGGVVEARQHNAFGETTRVTFSALGVPLIDTSFERDKRGRITRKTETIEGVSTVTEYGFDPAGRLEMVVVDGNLVAAYSWDRNGNRLAASTASGTALASYDAQDRLLSHGDATFIYTAAGELATRTDLSGTTSYQYDPLGNLRRVDLPDGRVIEYLIDGRNRRIGKRIDGVLVQGFLYRDQLEPVAELDGAGNVVARFVYGSKPQVPDYVVKAGVMYRIVSDHLGSPRVVINTVTGAIAQRMDFDEWGNVTLDTAPGFQPFGFAGGIHDAHTGMTRFGARDYSAAEGRWTAKDPTGLAAGTNVYEYAFNDPVNFIDPEGESPLESVGDFFNGFADSITFGGVGALNDLLGAGAQIDRCGGAYGGGEWAGLAWSLIAGAAGGSQAAGSAGRGREFSHWIPNRVLRNGPGWMQSLGRTKANGNFVTPAQHALSDPFRYRFMPAEWKAANAMPSALAQQWARMPNALKGLMFGGIWGLGGGAAADAQCGCE